MRMLFSYSRPRFWICSTRFRAQVDQQVGIAHHLLHQFEEGGVVVEVTGVHQSHVVQVRREYHRVLVDGAVLDYILPRVLELDDVLEPLVEEVHLEVERPPLHVVVEIHEIGVEIHRLEVRFPSVMPGQQTRKGGLAAAYVSCYRYVHIVLT